MSFKAERALPGVTHIMDAMGVCMTLLEGKDRALLIDAGYGLENVRDYVQTLTDRPVSLILTHGHHDHALGAMHFEQALMHPAEEPVYRTYTADFQRRQVLMQAAEKDLGVDEAVYLRAPVPEPEMITGGELDLGGLTARVIPCLGHTPGSLVVYVPEHRLLLTGDDWNPTTWLFFPEALPVWDYLKNMRALLDNGNGVSIQTAELGKVDVGGGGTIAYILALYGMNVIDSGVPVLNMHAPFEATSKADIYEAFRGYKAFLAEASLMN